jgi:hypothetical protein
MRKQREQRLTALGFPKSRSPGKARAENVERAEPEHKDRDIEAGRWGRSHLGVLAIEDGPWSPGQEIALKKAVYTKIFKKRCRKVTKNP